MSRTVLKIAGVLAGAGLLGIAGWSRAADWHPATDRYPSQGVDLAADAAAIDWPAVRAAGAQFGYLVATAGTRGRAPAFEANWQALDEAGLRRGAVHDYSLCEPALAQADAFNTVVPRDAGALPAAVDLHFDEHCADRPDRARLIGDLAQFLARVEAHTGTPVLLRIARPVERAYTLSAALPRPIWEVGNLVAPDYATRPWRIWRASDMRRIEGVDDPVNWDVVAR